MNVYNQYAIKYNLQKINKKNIKIYKKFKALIFCLSKNLL